MAHWQAAIVTVCDRLWFRFPLEEKKYLRNIFMFFFGVRAKGSDMLHTGYNDASSYKKVSLLKCCLDNKDFLLKLRYSFKIFRSLLPPIFAALRFDC